tara:strand:+ start:249 stop:425 length:177 start_codon:yes stop_codon:yes gene_type:complete
MALENLQSVYGPTNKKGQKGTGEVLDTLANEGTSGLNSVKSKFAGKEKNGTPEKSMLD